jgi:hypothetical protein
MQEVVDGWGGLDRTSFPPRGDWTAVLGPDGTERHIIPLEEPPAGQVSYHFLSRGCPYIAWTEPGLDMEQAVAFAASTSSPRHEGLNIRNCRRQRALRPSGSAGIGVAAEACLLEDQRVRDPDEEPHTVEVVQRDRREKGDDAAYWRCSCGESAGGRWYSSSQEAAKAADRHLRRARD